MAGKAKKKTGADNNTLVSENRKARFNYDVEDTFEAGIELQGTEVKSMREVAANIAESFAEVRNDEAWLVNAYIPECKHGNRNNHEPRRVRKLLLNRREINKLAAAVQKEGMTLVPLKLYFNDKGRAKLLLGLARGRKKHDKREVQKQRDWQRQKGRLMREIG